MGGNVKVQRKPVDKGPGATLEPPGSGLQHMNASARVRFHLRSARAYALTVGLVALVVGLLPAGDAQAATTQLTQMAPMQASPYTRFYKRGAHEAFSSVAVGDVTGDSASEFVVGGMDGHVRVFASTGSLVASYDTGEGAVQASPSLFDFDSDGKLDVLVANVGTSKVSVLRGTDGALLFDREAAAIPGDPTRRGVFATPTVGDVDGDFQLEIVATGWDHHVHVWNLDGTYVPGFPRFLYDTIWSSPALADLDKDGWLEIVFGGDMDEYPGQPYPTGGLLWVIRHDGSVQPGFPRSIPGRQTIWSSPAVTDLDGDGWLDIVFGTGLNFNDAPENGHRVHAVDRFGNYLPGWPEMVGDRVMASPAVGDLHPAAGLEVATLSEDGYIHVHTAAGTELWAACNVTGYKPCGANYGVHGSVSIADVDNDGQQEVLGAAEHVFRVFNGANGQTEASVSMGQSWAPPTPPTITQVSGETWVLQPVTLETNTDGLPGTGDTLTVHRWRTGTPLGRADWPTFKQNSRRTGSVLDDVPPTVAFGALGATQSHTSFEVTWSGTDAGSGIVRFSVEVREDGGSWTTWVSKAPQSSGGGSFSGSKTFFGIAGRQYDFRINSIDAAGNWSSTATASTSIDSGATRDQPFASAYVSSWDGVTSAVSSPPGSHPTWPNWDIVRGVAAHPDGGGYVLDAFGGVHRIGNAPALNGNPYWRNWDITRGIALNTDGAGGVILDGFGGLHPFGQIGAVTQGPYWPGWDVAHEVEMSPVSTGQNPKGLIMDRWGGLHPFGGLAKPSGGPYWPGWEIARGVALDPDDPQGRKGVILDGWGGLHPFGGAQAPTGGPYWKGWDIARDVIVIADGDPSVVKGYIVDAWGGVHAFGGAPAVTTNQYRPGGDYFRFMDVAP